MYTSEYLKYLGELGDDNTVSVGVQQQRRVVRQQMDRAAKNYLDLLDPFSEHVVATADGGVRVTNVTHCPLCNGDVRLEELSRTQLICPRCKQHVNDVSAPLEDGGGGDPGGWGGRRNLSKSVSQRLRRGLVNIQGRTTKTLPTFVYYHVCFYFYELGVHVDDIAIWTIRDAIRQIGRDTGTRWNFLYAHSSAIKAVITGRLPPALPDVAFNEAQIFYRKVLPLWDEHAAMYRERIKNRKIGSPYGGYMLGMVLNHRGYWESAQENPGIFDRTNNDIKDKIVASILRVFGVEAVRTPLSRNFPLLKDFIVNKPQGGEPSRKRARIT